MPSILEIDREHLSVVCLYSPTLVFAFSSLGHLSTVMRSLSQNSSSQHDIHEYEHEHEHEASSSTTSEASPSRSRVRLFDLQQITIETTFVFYSPQVRKF